MVTAITITIMGLTGISLAVGATPVVGVTSVVGVLVLVGVVSIDSVLMDVVTLMTVKRCQRRLDKCGHKKNNVILAINKLTI